MADILKQLGIDTIPSVRMFCAEPAPSPACVPIEQRVREYIAQRYGSVWLSAQIASYASHEFVIHAATIDRSFYPILIVEHDGGELSIAAPLPNEEEELY